MPDQPEIHQMPEDSNGFVRVEQKVPGTNQMAAFCYRPSDFKVVTDPKDGKPIKVFKKVGYARR